MHMLSNYPPGHPTGVEAAEHEFGFVWCERCNRVESRERETEPLPRCKFCNEWMEPLLCDRCEEEAVVEVYERDTNAAIHYCLAHAK